MPTKKHTKKGKRKGPKAFRILSLPRELRNMIYRKLLLPERADPYRKTYKIEPDILRVNKQMHREASEILYREISWVMFNTNYHAFVKNLKALDYNMIAVKHDNPLRTFPFGGTPALQADLTVGHISGSEAQDIIIVPLFDAQRICKAFTSVNAPMELEFNIRLDTSAQARPDCQEVMLECLRDIRGIGHATVEGVNPPSLGTEIAVLMMKPFADTDELMARAIAYQRRGERAVDLGRFFYAAEIYLDGFNFIRWAITSFGRHRPCTPANAAGFRNLANKKQELITEYAFCHIKQGSPASACCAFESMVLLNARMDDDLPKVQKAKSWYYYGLALVAVGAENRALNAFIHALVLRPGYEAADQEVDALEERIGRRTDLEDLRICRDWVNSAKPFRHQKTTGPELSWEEKIRLLTGFCHRYNAYVQSHGDWAGRHGQI